MFVVVGLGNPGEKYHTTRHNVGFMTVDRLNDRYSGQFRKARGPYLLSDVTIASRRVLLIKPTTYMNLSGQAVQHVIRYYKVKDLSQLVVVLDDFHLPFGTLRLRPSGSAAGQKGLGSIQQLLGTSDVCRLRIGIGDASGTIPRNARQFVLSGFGVREQRQLEQVLDGAADACECIINDGRETAMNRYNRNILMS